MMIKPSWALLERRLEAADRAGVSQLHREEARASPFAKGYGDDTEYEPLTLSALRSRGAKVVLHGPRLGYPCACQIIETSEQSDWCAIVVMSQKTRCSIIHLNVNTRFLRRGPLSRYRVGKTVVPDTSSSRNWRALRPSYNHVKIQ